MSHLFREEHIQEQIWGRKFRYKKELQQKMLAVRKKLEGTKIGSEDRIKLTEQIQVIHQIYLSIELYLKDAKGFKTEVKDYSPLHHDEITNV